MDFAKAEQFILDKLQKELPAYLHYHSFSHTRDVLAAAMRIASDECLKEEDIMLLRTAVLYHDAGFTIQNKDHEEIGCDIARKTLRCFDYTDNEISIICGMIMATKIPQSPHNLLEEIICDADLDYLGREDFWTISNNLYEELNNFNQLNKEDWYRLQINFFEQHHYFTSSVTKLRTQTKKQHLKQIRKLLAQLRTP
ncbi:MAG TPA: HD domain-containing protein [Chitinophagaceae bacterium]|jgi:predicted metal-dependent HD superfamily phosphohydrolase